MIEYKNSMLPNMILDAYNEVGFIDIDSGVARGGKGLCCWHKGRKKREDENVRKEERNYIMFLPQVEPQISHFWLKITHFLARCTFVYIFNTII